MHLRERGMLLASLEAGELSVLREGGGAARGKLVARWGALTRRRDGHRASADGGILANSAWLLITVLIVTITMMVSGAITRAQAAKHVDVIAVKGVIDPVMAQYVHQRVVIAEQDGAQCLIIQLDTPGGSDNSMRSIVQDLLNSPVPVAVYVSPAGARAGSAGVFITLAANIAAMAPGTNIGAAHPVDVTGNITGTLGDKVTNDAAAYAEAIADRRGRNADWAVRSVRESVSITADVAVRTQVVDLIAENVRDLLDKIDGRTVSTAAGEQVMQTSGAEVHRFRISAPQEILHAIVDPNIAYLLLTVGLWAIVAELYHPGAIIPGVTGIISLILAFVAFGNLPVNWGGVALIVAAIIMFVLDIKVAGYGLSVGGAIAFALGSLMIFSPLGPVSPAMPSLAVSRTLIGVVTALIAAFFLFVVSAAVRAQRGRVISGIGTLVGQAGVATSDVDPEGTVQVRSELWTAVAEGGTAISKGDTVRVVGTTGVRLIVTSGGVPRASEVR